MCQYCLDSSPSDSSSHPHYVPAYERAQTTGALEAQIAHELSQDVFCEVDGFLKTMFPVSDNLVETVFTQASQSTGYYKSSRKQWSNYPTATPANEQDLYAPFVTLVQSISSCISKSKAGRRMSTNDVRWRDYHSVPPLSRDPGAPDVRPDIVATIGVADNESVPWSRILVPVEVKKRQREGSALLQLLRYMLMVFREAVDRCFVFGIVVACADMSVYLADRTGVLGSVVFNIHKEPRSFIRVIAGICTSSLADLGWDTSMTVIRERNKYTQSQFRLSKKNPKFSYQVPWNVEKEDYYWVIYMPKPKEDAEYGVMDEKDTEKFVLYQALNVQRGEVIRGRATRIWKAWLFDELTLPPEDRQLFIMKDTWRDDERRLEGEFYKHIGRHDGVATMRSYGVVYVDGKTDTVMTRIRRDLRVRAKPRCIDMSQRDIIPETIPSATPDRTRGNTTDYGIFADYLPYLDIPECEPRGKTHSRLIMESYGWPIKYALSLLELVQAMHDALAGHWAAHKKGVQHKDLSEGNILITARGKKGVGDRGMVIDFDYAKFMSDATLADDPISGTRPFMSGEILEEKHYYRAATVQKQGSTSNTTSRPLHTFHHDLESLFWILLWICICRAGPALRRFRSVGKADDSDALSQHNLLFTAPGQKQLGRNKRNLIRNEEDFDDCLEVVADYYQPLLPLLRCLWGILRKGYQVRHFDDSEAYAAFLEAFKDAEKSLGDKPEQLNEDQERAFQAEKRRREEDLMNWKRSPRKLARRGVDKPVAADERTRRANEAGPAAADPHSDEREESPTPLPPSNAKTSRAERKLIQDAMAPGPSTTASRALPQTGVSMQSMSRVSVAPTVSAVQSPPPSETSQTSAPVQTKSKKRGREGADDASVAGEESEQGGGGAKRAKRGRGGRGRGSGSGSGRGRGRGGGSRLQPDRKGKGRAVDPS
ncbi:uncharacterized protein C8Q71DRAFT_849857 [Rhodofomes roseus]|uniref:Fungal-type protein kinase domain-containing protein n=1 Tax=Rhodofomes roseus TaxID=34475 RepID=A0ABQ8K8W1_9APHY|nr:uncharacterized protein C8Q71DRAFT_849857 [Rhodofomes roseus]KAH9833523.1 hypothetical protein C8Q71DRAFT_849857 [Rhodofomes roseus]